MLPASDHCCDKRTRHMVLWHLELFCLKSSDDGNAQRNIEPLTSFRRRTDFIKNCVRTHTCCLLAKNIDCILLMSQELEPR